MHIRFIRQYREVKHGIQTIPICDGKLIQDSVVFNAHDQTPEKVRASKEDDRIRIMFASVERSPDHRNILCSDRSHALVVGVEYKVTDFLLEEDQPVFIDYLPEVDLTRLLWFPLRITIALPWPPSNFATPTALRVNDLRHIITQYIQNVDT